MSKLGLKNYNVKFSNYIRITHPCNALYFGILRIYMLAVLLNISVRVDFSCWLFSFVLFKVCCVLPYCSSWRCGKAANLHQKEKNFNPSQLQSFPFYVFLPLLATGSRPYRDQGLVVDVGTPQLHYEGRTPVLCAGAVTKLTFNGQNVPEQPAAC